MFTALRRVSNVYSFREYLFFLKYDSLQEHVKAQTKIIINKKDRTGNGARKTNESEEYRTV